MRPTLDEYFMNMAEVVATRSTRLRNCVGAVIVKDKRIIATGYNGAPRNLEHCLDIGYVRDHVMIDSGMRHEICRACRAERDHTGCTAWCEHWGSDHFRKPKNVNSLVSGKYYD